MNKKKSFIGFIVICTIFLMPYFFIKLTKTLFNNTLDSLLRDTLGVNYRVVEVKYWGLFGFDPSASYWVLLDENSKNKTISILDNHHVPWLEEITGRKESIQEDFAYQGSFDGFKLYELGMAFNGSILCETKSSCNYYLFRKTGENNMFIDIVKF